MGIEMKDNFFLVMLLKTGGKLKKDKGSKSCFSKLKGK